MFQLLLTVVMVSIVFWVLWKLFGGKRLFASLVRDRLVELEEDLASARDQLESLPAPSTDEPESRTYLRQHLQGKIHQLDGKVSRELKRQRARKES